MADLLGFAYKVVVIALIVVVIGGLIAAGGLAITALQAPAADLNTNVTTGYQWHGNGDFYSPLSLLKPFLAAFGWNSGVGMTFDVWALLKALLVAIPALLAGAMGLRWLIRAAK